MNRILPRTLGRLLGGASVLALLTAAGPTDPAPNTPPPPAKPADTIENIVVVGQKQNKTIQKTPEAITALSAATLIQNHVYDAEDLNGLVPGIIVGESEGYNHNVAIRGIGLNSPQDDGAQASVSLHQDGIYIASSVALNADFLDVDHIEVLRGPQGTVFGQNSVGGTVNVITKLPSFDGISGYITENYGSYNLIHTTAAINIPLSDTFAIRLAGDQINQDGFANATQVPGTGGKYPLSDKNNDHGRVTARWQPNEDLSVVLRAEYSNSRQNEAESKNIDDPNPNPYEETSDWPGRLTYDQTILSAIVSYDLGFAVAKSLSSAQWMDQGGSVSEGGLDLALTSPNENVEYYLHDNRTLTQEFDLQSKPGGPIDWVVGGFFLQDRFDAGYDQYYRSFGDPIAPDILNDENENLVLRQLEDGSLYYESAATYRRTSLSAFGQTTYHITDALRATAGLRYTVDRNTTLLDNYFGDPDFGGGVDHLAQQARRFTWKGEADYDITPVNMIYASISTGFKPGGGNPATAPVVVPLNFKPEDILAYEVGSKNTFFDNHLTANIASFYYVDRNLQYHAEDLINFDGGVDNLPRVDVYGVEGEFAASLPYNVRLSGNATLERGRIATHILSLDNLRGDAANQEFIDLYGYSEFLTTEYGEPDNPLPNAQQILNGLRRAAYRDVYGNPPPNLPAFTATLAFAQTSEFQDGSTLLSRLQIQYRDHYADTVFGNEPVYTTPSYFLANLYFDYTLADRRWDVSFAINNLADTAAVAYRFTDQYGGETTQAYYPPREFIGGVAYHF
jgi:iron complex outermembrane receptor protein